MVDAEGWVKSLARVIQGSIIPATVSILYGAGGWGEDVLLRNKGQGRATP